MSEATVIDMENPVIDVSMELCDRHTMARAVAVSSKENNHDMFWCRHCIRQHGPKLMEDGWIIVYDGAQYEALGLLLSDADL
jgi:hypothetical protein